jgi:hypothetical protein
MVIPLIHGILSFLAKRVSTLESSTKREGHCQDLQIFARKDLQKDLQKTNCAAKENQNKITLRAHNYKINQVKKPQYFLL